MAELVPSRNAVAHPCPTTEAPPRGESLACLQARFHRLITQPRPVAEAARALADVDGHAFPLKAWIRSDGAEEADERLSIYARAHFARLAGSLREDYPSLAHVLGEAIFERVAAEYLVSHPSAEPSLHHFGRWMGTHLKTHPGLEQGPALADLARLEHARVESFGAAHVPLLSEDHLVALGVEDWATLPLRTTPSARLLEVDHQVDGAWLAADRKEPVGVIDAGCITIFVWRRDLVVRHRVVEPAEKGALHLLLAGTTLADVCETFVEEDGDVDGAAARALAALNQWVVDEVLCAP